MSEWCEDAHVDRYLSRADKLPRPEGERVLLDELPARLDRVLDLGSGDGRMLAAVLDARPGARGVAVDFSPAMLGRLSERFRGLDRVSIVDHDLTRPLPGLGTFDAVVSGFAIHHLEHDRKRGLYSEVFALLRPGGVFCNLDHVASPSERLHLKFLSAIDYAPQEEDETNRLLDVSSQLAWLREVGFAEVDCHWKWRELALMAGVRPA